MLIDLLHEINEGSAESGRGSKAGREKFASKEGTKGSSVKAKKSRVKVYDSIKAALDSGASYGTIFSTKSADRLYVITKPTWGDKSRAGGNTRVAKGFTPGSATPSANWPSIKAHAVRTMIKHGKTKSKRLTAKYGPGKSRPEEKRFSGKKVSKKESTQIDGTSLNERRVAKMNRLRESTSPQNWELFCEQLETLHEVAFLAAIPGAIAKGAGMAVKGAGMAIKGTAKGIGHVVKGTAKGVKAGVKGVHQFAKGVGRVRKVVGAAKRVTPGQRKPVGTAQGTTDAIGNWSGANDGTRKDNTMGEQIKYLRDMLLETVSLSTQQRAALKKVSMRRASKGRYNRRDRQAADKYLKQNPDFGKETNKSTTPPNAAGSKETVGKRPAATSTALVVRSKGAVVKRDPPKVSHTAQILDTPQGRKAATQARKAATQTPEQKRREREAGEQLGDQDRKDRKPLGQRAKDLVKKVRDALPKRQPTADAEEGPSKNKKPKNIELTGKDARKLRRGKKLTLRTGETEHKPWLGIPGTTAARTHRARLKARDIATLSKKGLAQATTKAGEWQKSPHK